MGVCFFAKCDADIERCYPVMAQLRPHVAASEFAVRVRRQMQSGGYHLAYLEEAEQVRSVAGFRIQENLYYGRFLYVDDLATDATVRSRGYGKQLFEWVVDYARQQECAAVALESGVQRFAAHRFYLANRMEITCHHFALKMK
jgi:GNAT superfamily N-acetyltransferase